MVSKGNSFIPSEIEGLFSSGTVIFFTCALSEGFPLLFVSKNSEEILGFDKNYFLEGANSWSARVHEEDRERVVSQFNRAVKSGCAEVSEYRFKRKDGTDVWLRDEIKVIEDKEKGESFVFGMAFDISDRKKSELVLKDNQEEYESVVAHVKDIIFKVDADGCLTFLNKPWIDRTGFSSEESYGSPFWKFIHPKDRESCRGLHLSLVNGDIKSATRVIKCRRKYNDPFWTELYLKKLPGSESIVGTLVDISADISRREEIEGINAELEDRINQRSKDLEQEIKRRTKAEEKLQKRLIYQKAISKCSNLLLQNKSSKALEKSMNVLLDVTEADRVYLYRNSEEEGEVYCELAMEVCDDGIDSVMGTISKHSYSKFPWWFEKLSKKKVINAKIDEIPQPERRVLENQQVKSLLVLPIFIDQEWLGYIGFADTKNKKRWQQEEISLLKTASEIIASFEKKKAIKKSLVDQRNFTETILNSLPSIYLLMDEDLHLVQWNKNAEHYSGYQTEELKDKTAFDLIAAEDHKKLKAAVKKLINGSDKGMALPLRTKQGQKVAYSWRGDFIELEGTNYFLFTGIDITQQKKAEKELLDEKRFNDALIESLPGVFYMFDENGKYHRWNRNLVDELGYDVEQMLEMGPADVFDEEDFIRVSREIDNVYKKGQSEIEADLLTKNGEKIPYYFTGKEFVRNGSRFLIGVGQNISEQKKARERLRKSENLFRNLFLKAPAAIAMVNPDNKVQQVNKSFENLFGYTEKEICGKDIDQLIVPPEENKFATESPAESYTMDSFHKEAKRITKSGELIDVFVAGIPVYIDGEPLAGFGMYIDITDQKKYEKEIYTSLQEKNVLLQEIHHRVKNNLAVISGLIQLQMYETDDLTIRSTLQESERRIQTMALIHEKLYQSKNLSRISCNSYINDLVKTIGSTIGSEKDISIITEIEDVKLNINKAVPFALLVNEMITNSFKHGFKGREKGEIKINLSGKDRKLKVRISDNGIGLPEDFSLENQSTLGMTLIYNFIQQLDAEWEIGTDNGTYLDLSFCMSDVKGSSASDLF